MKKKVENRISIGVFVSLGLVLLIGAVYYIGSQQALFGSKVDLTATFKNVAGLQSGNNVRFSGIKIGVVKQIEIASDSTARVHLLINKDAASFVKEDAIATIDSDGLMGNKILSISSGSSEANSIAAGAQLKTKEPLGIEDVISSIKGTSDNAQKLTANLNTISEQIKNAEGLLGKVVSDSVLAQRVSNLMISLENTSENAASITREIEKATHEINEGDGLLTKAIYDKSWSQDIEQTLDSIKHVGYDLSASSKELKKFMKKLNNNKGAVNMLLNDSVVAKDLELTIENVKNGTAQLDDAIRTVDNSWLLNLFSGKDKSKKEKKPK